MNGKIDLHVTKKIVSQFNSIECESMFNENRAMCQKCVDLVTWKRDELLLQSHSSCWSRDTIHIAELFDYRFFSHHHFESKC